MIYLCKHKDLDKTQAKSLTITLNKEDYDLFLVRNKQGIFAYKNRCPHAGTPLEWQEDQFLNAGGDALMCATHGALFEIHNGQCISGPCRGEGLTPLKVILQGESIYLEIAG